MVTLCNRLTAGETFTADIEDYSDASAVLVTMRGPEGRDLTPTLADGTWSIEAATDSWKAGTYEVKVWVTTDGVKSVVYTGRVNVSALAAQGSAVTDPRTIAEQIVAAIDAHLAGGGQDPTWKSYKIHDREMERYSVIELMQMRSFYQRIVVRERRQARGNYTLGPRIACRI